MAADYHHGEMDISEHSKTFQGFIDVSIYSTLVTGVVILFAVLHFGAHVAWFTDLFICAALALVGGLMFKRGVAYWATIIITGFIGLVIGGGMALFGA
ncbi:aa3-type cytochrome c oxidase subunit IV [Woodsholea maritima]|uniref:aa3-type cytochrome c oxidase subunit IV n=1 Tax=Woodsholea maritima TaxID=240237 RepID=UPI0003658B5E|nr:aa3-type cytochrome c oxidase subunit IV [Woodsholea maritima]